LIFLDWKYIYIHGKNDFAEVSKNSARSENNFILNYYYTVKILLNTVKILLYY